MREMAVQVRVTGRVQGVAYRAWTRAVAASRGIRGWVRNRDDGSVEAVLAGPEDAVKAMIAAMSEGPGAARVTDVWTEPADPATAPERTITYTVTGDRQLFDLVTVIYTDEQGFPRTDINVALPWTRTVVLNPGVNLKSVTATSVAGKLNCAISNGSGDLLVQQNAGTILAACTN